MAPTLLTAVLAAGLAAPAPKDPPPKGDNPLVGTWALDSLTVGGMAVPGLKGTVTFARDGTYTTKLEATPPLAAQSVGGTYALDSKKSPAEFDITSAAGGQAPARTSRGVYKVDGDTLTVCTTTGGARPTTLDAPAGSDRMLMVLKRVADKDK